MMLWILLVYSQTTNNGENILVTLNDGQANAKKVVLGIINRKFNSKIDKFITLRGPAGCGKTFTVTEILKGLGPSVSVGLTSPTHKACAVLRQMAFTAGITNRCDIRTIHSALGLSLKQVDGAEVISKDKYAEERIYDVLFIDECSMIGDDLLSYIIRSDSRTIIFVGDIAQISPVDGISGEVSKTFTEVSEILELTDIVRQAQGNPIIELATALRLCQEDMCQGWPKILPRLLEDGSGVDVLPKSKWFSDAVSVFSSEEFKKDPDLCRCVAYTNKTVDMINDRVRKVIHGQDVAEYIKNETIVAQGSGKFHKNAEEMRIMSLESIDDEVYNLPCWSMKLYSLHDDVIHNVLVLDESSKKRYQAELNKFSELARIDSQNKGQHWKSFWSLKNTFDDFKHIYAMSAHKSQGSTIKLVYVYTPDFVKFGATMDIKRLMYTATTRASFKTTFAY
jgi:exodeoxyribonuclease-5